MEFLIPVSVLGFAAALWKGGKVGQFAPALAWVALIGVFVAVQQGVWLSGAAIVAAVCLGLAASLPAWNHELFRNRAVWAAPIVVLPAGLIASNAELSDPYFIVLLAAALASTVAGVGLVASAALAANPRGLAPAAAASVAGAIAIGLTRTPVGEGLQIPLKGAEGPLFWELPSIERMPEGLRLLGTFAAPEWLVWVAASACLAALLAFVLGMRPKITVALAALGAVLSGAGFAAMRALNASSLPDTKPYVEFTRLTLQNRQIDPIVADNAGFVKATQVAVDHAALAPESMLWALGCVSLAATAWFARQNAPDATRLARDLFVRGLTLVWLGWFLTVLFYSSSTGALGFFAAGEWVHLGLVLLTTAVVLLGWRQNTVGKRILKFATPLVLAAWIFLGAVAWIFKSVLGISLVLG